MAITTIARIQHRRGLKTDLPTNLNEGELGWCLDTRELFIGNSIAEGGNTQVLTSNVDLGSVIRYQFVSDTQVPSQTGVTMSQPVVRTLQKQLDDYWVNVKAYGAVGNGIVDDTAAINRAIEDLYTKLLTTQETVEQTRKAIWFPSGVYLITEPLLVYPNVTLVGENTRSTQIYLLNDDTTQPCVLKLVDGDGQQDGSIGDNGADLPENILISHLTISTGNDIDVVWLQRCNQVQLLNCHIQGIWQNNDPVVVATRGVVVETLGAAINTGNIQFTNCVFSNLGHAYYCQEEAVNVSFQGCTFQNLFKGIVTDTDGVGGGPSYTRVIHSRFDQIDDMGIHVMSTNPGVMSTANLFTQVGDISAVQVIYWSTGSDLCSSVNDVFDRTSTPPDRIYNGEPTSNMVVCAQEPINMPVP